MSLSLNRMSQEELKEIEELSATLANGAVNQFEQINLIGTESYGKPELPEENTCRSERSNAS